MDSKHVDRLVEKIQERIEGCEEDDLVDATWAAAHTVLAGHSESMRRSVLSKLGFSI